MSNTFLSSYHALKAQKITNITGLWLIHGNEPLLHTWFVDGCRPIFNHNQQIIKRMELNNAKDWDNVIGELGSLSLFGEDVAIVLTGKAKPSNAILSQLDRFADDANNHATNHALIYSLPQQDKKAQSTKLFGLFARKGSVIDASLHSESVRESILMSKADELGVQLDDEAWHFVLTHTENNLLSAHQALMRAADLYAHSTHALDVNAMMEVLVSDYQYSVFNLSDNILAGNVARVLQILNHLKQTDTAPSLVLWALTKEIGQILRLQDGQSFEKLGIWRNKTTLYRNAANSSRFCAAQLADIYDIDKSIKGLSQADSWQKIEHLVLNLCGVATLAEKSRAISS